jgi:hypothetical protein
MIIAITIFALICIVVTLWAVANAEEVSAEPTEEEKTVIREILKTNEDCQ